MAEKLSIDIDLRNSKHVVQPGKKKYTAKVSKNHTDVPVEFVYHYDRMFYVFVIIILLIIALYFVTSIIVTKEPTVVSDKVQSLSKKSVVETVTKERFLTVPPPSTAQIPHAQLFLYHENIDVFETFHSTPILATEVGTKGDDLPESPDVLMANDSEKKPFKEPSAQPSSHKMTNNNTAEQQPDSTLNEVNEVPAEQIIEVPVKQSDLENNQFIQKFSTNLSRVLLVSNIYNKEPAGELSSLVTGPADRAEKIYLFTQLDNSMGQVIEHQWWYQGKMLNQQKFTALGNRWRCYSSKNLNKFMQGKWMLKVLDQEGKTLSIINFQYQIN